MLYDVQLHAETQSTKCAEGVTRANYVALFREFAHQNTSKQGNQGK